MENNLDKFNYYVGCVFALLQDEFPCRQDVDFLKLIECEKCPESYLNDFSWTWLCLKDGKVQNIEHEYTFAYETVNWLYETGYLIGRIDKSNGAFVTLSPKALEVLKVIPASLGSPSKGKSIGQELSEAVKSGVKSQVSQLASNALSYLFKAGWDALSSP